MKRTALLRLGCIALLCVALAAPAFAGDKNRNKPPVMPFPGPPLNASGPLPPPINPDSWHPQTWLPIVSSTGDIRLINSVSTTFGYHAPSPATAPPPDGCEDLCTCDDTCTCDDACH